MQAPTATSASPFFQSVVNFLVSLDVDQRAAIAIANNNDGHASLLVGLYSVAKVAPRDELCDRISQYLRLPQALEGAIREMTKEILEDYFLVTHASISFGMRNPSVQQFRSMMLECAREYCSDKETVALDDFVLQCGVTIYDLLETKGTPAGGMSVFPEVLRDHIIGAIPNAPALLEHLLAEFEAARPRKRVREVLEEPGKLLLFCDENISDRGSEETSTDSADDEEASAEDETGFTTPELRGMSDRERDRERKRLLCAPLKKRRGDQD
jgi:hypothetical protein